MHQIRFDFLGGVNGNNSRGNGASSGRAETGDAFAQILDQQMTRRADAGAKTRSVEPRDRGEASDRPDASRPQATKRRDGKHDSVTEKPESNAKSTAKTTKHPEKAVADHGTCAKPAAKPEETEQSSEAAAAGGQTTTETKGAGSTTESEGHSDTSGESGQQQAENGAQQAQDGTDQDESGQASTDVSLLAMLAVPLPLQTVTAGADTAVDADLLANGGNAAAALQAELAGKLAGAIDLTAATNVKAQANAGGLKFGAVLNANLGDANAGAEAVAALQDAAEELAKAADPLAQLSTDANVKVKDTKPRDAAPDKAPATVTPELSAKASAAVVQPMARASAVTWSGTTSVRNELAESMAVQADARFSSDDAEFSNWSQVLGSGTSLGSSLAARQSAFMNQLRQSVQNLPAHEQIAVQIKNAMNNGNSRLTVALHPVELGRVEVKLDIDKDKNVTATIVVDRPATLDLLRNDAKALERALQDAGLQTGNGSLSFNLRDSNGQNGSPTQNGTGTGGGSGQGTGNGGSETRETARADVVATADGYVDLEA